MDINNEIMTVNELAAYLKLAEKTILRLVHRRELRSFKVAGQWRFRRSDISEWIMTKIQGIPSSDLTKLIESNRESVTISKLVKKDFILADIKPGTKEEVLDQLIRPLVGKSIILDKKDYLDKLMQRERMASTSLTGGAAIPHIRNPKENPQGGPYLVLGICHDGTDFESMDGEAAYLFVLLCAGSETVHLRIMAKMTLLLRRVDLVKRMVKASNAEDILSILIQEESKVFGPKDEGEEL